MHSTVATAVVAATAGALLGWLYLRALWRSVREVAQGHRSSRWMAGMLVLRLGLAACALSATALWAGWQALLAALCGFVVARMVFLRRAQPAGNGAGAVR